jgi:ribonuclease J
MKLGDRIPSSYIFVDGSGVGDVDPQVMREREALAQDGVVVVSVRLNRGNGRLQEEPQIMTRGFIPSGSLGELVKESRHKIEEAIRNPNGDVKKNIENTLGNYFYAETRRKPMIFVMVNKG